MGSPFLVAEWSSLAVFGLRGGKFPEAPLAEYKSHEWAHDAGRKVLQGNLPAQTPSIKPIQSGQFFLLNFPDLLFAFLHNKISASIILYLTFLNISANY